MISAEPAVWFPAIRTGTGTDMFTLRLAKGLLLKGIRAEVTWLPHRAEFLPWTVPVPPVPVWANVVHVNTWLHQRFIPPNLPVLATMHLCVHDGALSPYKSAMQELYHRIWIRHLEVNVLRRAQRVVAVSRYTAESTKQAFRIRDIEVIHNGVSIPEGMCRLTQRQVHTPFRLLYVGNWSARKGVSMLGPIMAILGAEFELYYTADSKGAEANVKLPRNCICIGRINSPEEMQEAYKQADALIFPTRLEGLPLTVIEAMANGLPVVCSNCTSLPEIIDDGVTGMMCPVDDVEGFCSAIRRLKNDLALWHSLRVNAVSMVAQNFDQSVSVEHYAMAYRGLI
ncbi:MAG: glycosyltransferase family 4 protein [Gammaproteobacteria bacterium]|nr:glycosyltransferase family 4 protein [Gammaproteobacteria bacterium]